MLLSTRTWPAVEEYLGRSQGIILPIGSTEQHGPTGLIGTDALTAEMIARGAGEKVGALVAPTISVILGPTAAAQMGGGPVSSGPGLNSGGMSVWV